MTITKFCFDGYYNRKGRWHVWWEKYPTWDYFVLARDAR